MLRTIPSRALLVVATVYLAAAAAVLFHTRGLPYGLDGNETFSNTIHARNLYTYGWAQSFGLTDESYGVTPAAHPFIHSHQGNFPRLFVFLLYALGARSVEAQVVLTTLTIGLLALVLAFLFCQRAAGTLFALLACLVFISDYFLFGQWHLNTYRVWHCVFFFSSLLCAQGFTRRPSAGWGVLTVVNFACLGYWEYVFAFYVLVLSALYAVFLRPRSFRVVAGFWGLQLAGAGLAASLLIGQLSAYMGWANVWQDVRYTLHARNSAEDQVFARQVQDFYSRLHVLFWPNYVDTTRLRNPAAFVDSLLRHHLQYYSPWLAFVMVFTGLAWAVARPIDRLGRRIRRQGPARRVSRAQPLAIAAQCLVLGAAGGGLLSAYFSSTRALAGRPGWIPPAVLGWPLACGSGAVAALGLFWLARRRHLRHATWPRVILGGAVLSAAAWWLGRCPAWFDWTEAGLWRMAGWNHPWLRLAVVLGVLALLVPLLVLGPHHVVGRAKARGVDPILGLLLAGLAAYGITYSVFTGYVYSGYLNRQAPLLVFLSDPLLALVLYTLVAALAVLRTRARTGGMRWLPAAALGLVLLAVLAGWSGLQRRYWQAVPPDSHDFLKLLARPPFRQASFAVNTYAAPVAVETHSWAYLEPVLFTGSVRLTGQGFHVERESTFRWLADLGGNPVYARPEYALAIRPTDWGDIADGFGADRADAAARVPLVKSVGLAQRAAAPFSAFLHDQIVARDPDPGTDRYVIVKLDWDFPAYLRPLPAGYSRIAPTGPAATGGMEPHWLIALQPLPVPAGAAGPAAIEVVRVLVDNRPVDLPAASLAEPGWRFDRTEGSPGAAPVGPEGGPRLQLAVTGREVQIELRTGPGGGRVRICANDLAGDVDLASPTPGSTSVRFRADAPCGILSSRPTAIPGQYATLAPAGDQLKVVYDYAQQEGRPEADTEIDLLQPDARGDWRLLRSFRLLPRSDAVVDWFAFRAANPDLDAEYARIHQLGDPRNFSQWLADFLEAHPGDRHRPGLSAAGEAAALSGPGVGELQPGVRAVFLPMPAVTRRPLLAFVRPGTRTKLGPIYPTNEVFAPGTPLPTPAAPAPDRAAGIVHLDVVFPAGRAGASEPLVTTGVTGAGDFVYVAYVDRTHIRLGFDHWGVRGFVTPPLAIDYTKPHHLDIMIGSLFPPDGDIWFQGMPAARVAELKGRVWIRLDGQSVLDAASDTYDSPPEFVGIGRNDIGGSTTGPTFTGRILAQRRSGVDPAN